MRKSLRSWILDADMLKILNKIGYLQENLICCFGFIVDVYLNCPLKL